MSLGLIATFCIHNRESIKLTILCGRNGTGQLQFRSGFRETDQKWFLGFGGHCHLAMHYLRAVVITLHVTIIEEQAMIGESNLVHITGIS